MVSVQERHFAIGFYPHLDDSMSDDDQHIQMTIANLVFGVLSDVIQ